MNYNNQYAGRYFQMVDAPLYSINAYGKMAAAYVSDGTMFRVQLTGYYLTTDRGNIVYQTTSGQYIYMDDGWQDAGAGTIYRAPLNKAQALVNTIIENNKTIIANNILCARFSYKLNEQQQEQLRTLQNRLQVRDKSLREDGICSDMKESYPQGYSYLESYLNRFMEETSGVGSLTATIIISAVVVASLATAAYFAYKSMAEESEKDVKYSKELTRVLTAKLTEEEYTQLLNETKGIVTKSKVKASLGSYGNILKWGLVAAAGVAAYRFISKNMKK